MISIPELRTRRILPMVMAILCASLIIFSQGNALADPRGDFLKERAVRVIVRGANPNTAASGFLWKHQNWIVTNLHAIPSDKDIKVSCRGSVHNAKVVKVLPSADLALLVVDQEGGKDEPPFDRCKPFTEANLVEPPLLAPLIATGWLGDAAKAMSLPMQKTETGTLTEHFPKNTTVLKELKKYGIPDIANLDFYIMSGGSLPGYSGGSIVDDDLRLVAIVDGGLNGGLNTIKWAIPASNLKELEENGVPWEANYGVKPKWLWSTGIVDPDESSVLKYSQIDTFSPDGSESTYFDYEWHRTKSLTLRQLARTSVDPDGLLSLLDTYGAAAGIDVDPTFEVYEDLKQGLIIAIPSGQGMEFGPVPNNPGYNLHESKSKHEMGGDIQFNRTTFAVTSSSDLRSISPGDPRFFSEKVSELLAECNEPGLSECSVDPKVLRVVRFDNGNAILKVGFFVRWPDGSRSYDYYSFAIRDNVAFRAFVQLFAVGETGLIPCANNPTETTCANPELALSQLLQMLSVHLTTFANLGQPGSEQSPETNLEYDPRGNDPSTFGAGYFDASELRFYNSRGKVWKEYLPKRTNEYNEYERDADYVLVKSGEDFAKIPIDGGQYFRSSDNGQNWASAGVLIRK